MTPRALQRGGDGRLGRDVAPAEILGERAADGLAIERRIERRERHRLHAAPLLRPLGRRQLHVDAASVSASADLEPLDQPGGAQVALDLRQERQHAPAGACTTTRRDRRLERPLLFGLLLADRAEHAPPRSRSASTSASVSSAPPHAASTSSGVGHAARCTEPACHHDQTSSVTNGRNGANSRSSVESAHEQRAVGRRRQLRPLVAVAARLHQLEVVVAERPEERLGALEHARVVVVLEIARSTRRRAARASSAARDRAAAVTGPRGSGRASTNFDALSSLIASRRPTFICPGSNAVSVPGRPLAAQ